MRDNRELVELLHNFGMNPAGIETVKRGVYRVTAPDGELYCLKRMGMPTAQLVWMDSVLLAMRQTGFRSAAWRDPSSAYGKTLYACRSGQSVPYILTPWLTGTVPSSNSLQQLYACAQTLARFHRSGQALNIARKGSVDWLGQWPKLLKARFELMERSIRNVQRGKPSNPFESLLQEHGTWLLERGRQALRLVDNKRYRQLCRAAKQSNAVLCHADSGPNNFVLTGDGPALIDFESMRYDLRIFDLYRLIRLASKKNGWSPLAARTIVDGYTSASGSGLADAELDLLKAWLLFPQKAYRAIRKYDRADTASRRRLSSKLTKGIHGEQPIAEFLEQFIESHGME
ncbi:hypothetical protein SD70_12320 [Gordoniibacillus kamchatkensis]|uniref:Aminoglycoside phosphotransferase domain-containing protein n=1 Tax=Gordoniibacillus kamchatkensis TaxID=1590651 RepID=A0ABR5AHP3_9BACL|nr:phosphotransferase [Paenibacillus sp. VKM B-2647]KIL40539.1 hypothetical protein SD70_12320 [Paenibacillus sp. VKM B-2647]